jgi:hypothetical protein
MLKIQYHIYNGELLIKIYNFALDYLDLNHLLILVIFPNDMLIR